MNEYESRVIALEREITALKTATRKSSQNLATITKSQPVTFQNQGIGGAEALFYINAAEASFFSYSINTTVLPAGDSKFTLTQRMENGKRRVRIQLAIFDASDVPATIPFTFEMTSTDDFTYTFTQEQL